MKKGCFKILLFTISVLFLSALDGYGEEPRRDLPWSVFGSSLLLPNKITMPQHPTVLRLGSNDDDTIGSFFLGGEHQHFTLEDEYRTKKVYGETRIPAGVYPLALRTEGRFHEKYKQRFPLIHQGMVWIRNVPGFQYVLYHCGNNDKDTAGCILCGDVLTNNVYGSGYLGRSREAYERTYPKLTDYIRYSGNPRIQIIDLDRPVEGIT